MDSTRKRVGLPTSMTSKSNMFPLTSCSGNIPLECFWCRSQSHLSLSRKSSSSLLRLERMIISQYGCRSLSA